MQELGVLPHMGGQLLHDEVDLAVVQTPVHLLPEEQIVKHGLVAPLIRDDLLSLHIGLIGGGGNVLVLPKLPVERLVRLPAHIGAGVVLVLVLIEGVAQRMLLAVRLEGRKLHVRQLGHVVDLIGRVDGGAQGRQDALGLRLELIGLLPQQVLQIGPAGAAPGDGLAQKRFVLGNDLAVDKAQAAAHLGIQAGKGFVPLLKGGIAVVHGRGQIAVICRKDSQLFQLLEFVQAGQDGLRGFKTALAGLLNLVCQQPDIFHVGGQLRLIAVNGRQVPGQFLRDVFALHQLHRFILLVLSWGGRSMEICSILSQGTAAVKFHGPVPAFVPGSKTGGPMIPRTLQILFGRIRRPHGAAFCTYYRATVYRIPPPS